MCLFLDFIHYNTKKKKTKQKTKQKYKGVASNFFLNSQIWL